MLKLRLLASLLCLPCFGHAASAGGGIAWQPTLDAAFQAAAEGHTVVFLAVNMDGERANEEAAKRLYHDKEVVELAALTAPVVASRFEHGSGSCPRFGTIRCTDHQEVDKKARAKILKPGMDGEVIAPQHVWLAADGTVLLSVPYEVSKQELEWCFVTAINKADPERKLAMPSGARAPRRLVMDGVADGGADAIRPLSDEEVEAAVKQLRTGIDVQERLRLVYSLIATDHPDAVEAVAKELIGANVRGGGRGGRGGGGEAAMAQLNERKRALLLRIGIYSPPAYWEAVATQAEDEDDQLRLAAAVALEELAAPDSFKLLKERLRKEEVLAVKAALLRAMGTAGAGQSGARSQLMSVAKKKKGEARLKRNALFALGNHAADKSVAKHFLTVAASGSAEERQALILGLAFARNRSAFTSIQAALSADGMEISADTAETLDLAQKVLDGGNLSLLASRIEAICGDAIRRERFFGKAEG